MLHDVDADGMAMQDSRNASNETRALSDAMRASAPRATDDDPSVETRTRLWDAALAYGKYLELAATQADMLEQARRAREQVAVTRARVVSDRAKRALDGEERARLREAVRAYVSQLKSRGESLDEVLHGTGTLLRGLCVSGDVADEAGAFEVDVQRIVAEEYCDAA